MSWGRRNADMLWAFLTGIWAWDVLIDVTQASWWAVPISVVCCGASVIMTCWWRRRLRELAATP